MADEEDKIEDVIDVEDTTDDDDEITLDTDTEDDGDNAEGEDTPEGEEDASDEDADETVVSFGDEDAEGSDEEGNTQWIKDLRQKNRDQNKEINELKREREQYIRPATELGPRPTLEEADYDAEAYENQLTSWLEQKNQFDNEAWHQENAQREEATAWQAKVNEYTGATATFEKEAYAESEDTVKEALNPTQQSMMIHILGAKLAPLIVGLGKNRTELRNLAAIKDVSLFAAAVGRLESKMKVSKRKPKTVPENRIASGGSGATVNNTLEALREKAAKTGDLTEVLKYKAKMRRDAA